MVNHCVSLLLLLLLLLASLLPHIMNLETFEGISVQKSNQFNSIQFNWMPQEFNSLVMVVWLVCLLSISSSLKWTRQLESKFLSSSWAKSENTISNINLRRIDGKSMNLSGIKLALITINCYYLSEPVCVCGLRAPHLSSNKQTNKQTLNKLLEFPSIVCV